MDVTVVIPSFRSDETLPRCLEALFKQTCDSIREIIVVHSGDRPANLANSLPDKVHVVDLGPEPLSPAAKRNVGLASSSTPWIAFLDADCVPSSGWMSSLTAAASKTNADGVGGSVEPATSANGQTWINHMLEYGDWLASRPEGRCKFFPTCNALFRRSTLVSVGGFVDRPGIPEDIITCCRIWNSGRNLWFEPSATVVHEVAYTTEGALLKGAQLGWLYRNATREHRLPAARLRRPSLLPVLVVGLFAKYVSRVAEWRRFGTRHGFARRGPTIVWSAPFCLRWLLRWSISYTNKPRLRSGARSQKHS